MLFLMFWFWSITGLVDFNFHLRLTCSHLEVHTVDCPKRQPGYQAILQGFWNRQGDDDHADAGDDIDDDNGVEFDDIYHG